MIQKAGFKFRTFRFLEFCIGMQQPRASQLPPHPTLSWPCSVTGLAYSLVDLPASRWTWTYGHLHTATLGHLVGQEVYRPEAHFTVGGQNQGKPLLRPCKEAQRIPEPQGTRMYSKRESRVGGHVLLNLWTPHSGSRGAIKEVSEQCHLN